MKQTIPKAGYPYEASRHETVFDSLISRPPNKKLVSSEKSTWSVAALLRLCNPPGPVANNYRRNGSESIASPSLLAPTRSFPMRKLVLCAHYTETAHPRVSFGPPHRSASWPTDCACPQAMHARYNPPSPAPHWHPPTRSTPGLASSTSAHMREER